MSKDKKKQKGEPKDNKGKDDYIIFDNPDKKPIRRMGPANYMPKVTSRILVSGPPNSGKRNLILNIIHRTEPPPSAIHVVHQDMDTHEYDILSKTAPVYVYPPDQFPNEHNIKSPEEDESSADAEAQQQHDEPHDARDDSSDEDKDESSAACAEGGSPIVIVDEVTADSLSKESRHRFERLVNYICTHMDTTLICSIQSLLNIPPKVARGFNVFCLWRQNQDALNTLVAQRSGIDIVFLRELFELCRTPYDFIVIDTSESPNSEWRYRLNLIEPISIHEPEEKREAADAPCVPCAQ